MSTDSLPQPVSTTSNDARRAARNAGALAAASILSKGALFGWQLILIPLLGPFEYGVYGTVGALLALGAPITSFAMGLIVIRDVARHPEHAGRYWSAMLFTQTLFSVLAYIGVNASASTLNYGETIQAFVAVAGISLIIDMFGNMGNELLLAHERMVQTSIIEVAHIILRLTLAGFALLAGFGLPGVYVATIISGIGRWYILWAFLLRSGIRPHWPLDKQITWTLIINSAPLALNAFLGLAYQHADKLMTTSFIGEAGTGYLTAAFVIVYGVIETLSSTILVAVFPMMSRYYGSPMFSFMIEKLAFFTAVVSLPLTLTISIFSANIFIPLFGEDYSPTATILSILIWYTLLTMVANVFSQGMMVQNRQRRLLAIQVIGLVINITLNLFLLPRLGVPGTAISTLCAEIIVFSVLIAAFREQGWDWKHIIPRMARLAVVGIITAISMILLGKLHPVIGIGGGLLLYTGTMLFTSVLQNDDWDLLYRLVAAMLGGAIVRRYWKRDVVVNW